MRVFYGFDKLPSFRNAVVTIGSYDGVHYGHRHIISLLDEQARIHNGESVVLTFSAHPRQVLGKEGVKLLNSLQEKIMLLEQTGVDNLIVIPFDEAFSKISSHEFIDKYLVGKIGMKVAVVGYNHRFGHDKESGAEVLNNLSGEYGLSVIRVDKCELDNHKVSSTEVRKTLEQGDVKLAAEYLCRPYFILGQIRHGELVWSEKDKLLPLEGLYNVKIDGTDDVADVRDGRIMLNGEYEEGSEVIMEFIERKF